jgi:hypothetical protein
LNKLWPKRSNGCGRTIRRRCVEQEASSLR